VPAFPQHRFDVSFEGPWIFYQAPNFMLADGTPSTVLVAIAPQVLGHRHPLFSAGDGAPVDKYGIYCVGFDGVCAPKSVKPKLDHDGYPDPSPVAVYKPAIGWDWTAMRSSAYVFILPMPDSYSADGQYYMTFQSTFPTAGNDPVTTESGMHSIGIQLHYSAGPQKFRLLSCPATPTAKMCNKPASGEQENSGTLRITIKSVEDPAETDICEYHVHRAYQRMLHLLDPNLKANSQKAYLDVPTYDNPCVPCDTQQETVGSDCIHLTSMMHSREPLDIPTELDGLVTFLRGVALSDDQRKYVELPELSDIAETLRGKFALRSQLLNLKQVLMLSERHIDDLLLQLAIDARIAPAAAAAQPNRNQDLKLRLEVAKRKESALADATEFAILSASSGKDCRAPAMLIQP
jgi:hypothetical protein